jgi:tetratricopeptide (TPR) repeat protein
MVTSLAGARVWLLGRFDRVSHRRLGALVRAKAGVPVRRRGDRVSMVAVANAMATPLLGGQIVLTHLESLGDGTEFISEMTLRRFVGLDAVDEAVPRPFGAEDICRLCGLEPELLFWLDLFDVLQPHAGRYRYADVVAARQVGRLLRDGAEFSAVVMAGVALARQGSSLARTQLAVGAGGALARCIDGDIVGLDGQYRLPLAEPEESVDDVIAGAEDAELAGDLAAATRLYRRAAGMDPLDPVVPFHLGNVLEAQGATAEAEMAWWRALRAAPDFADAWFNLAVLAETDGRPGKALPLYRAALARDPDHADAAYNLGMLLARRQDWAEALPLLERFLALEPAAPETPNARWHAAACRFALRGVFLGAL